jgi:hypothetical protein
VNALHRRSLGIEHYGVARNRAIAPDITSTLLGGMMVDGVMEVAEVEVDAQDDGCDVFVESFGSGSVIAVRSYANDARTPTRLVVLASLVRRLLS